METIVTLTENALEAVSGFIEEQRVGEEAGIRRAILHGA